jgi:hypothetical protein
MEIVSNSLSTDQKAGSGDDQRATNSRGSCSARKDFLLAYWRATPRCAPTPLRFMGDRFVGVIGRGKRCSGRVGEISTRQN